MPSSPDIAWPDASRRAAFDAWLAGLAGPHGLQPPTLRAASADASFRRYLRVDAAQGSRIIMDAPPAHEDCAPFVTVAHALAAGGLHAPEVLAWDREQGFMLLSDLGSRTYLAELASTPRTGDAAPAAAEALYGDALDALVQLQRIDLRGQVPDYDQALMQRELDLFPAWYVERHRGVTLTERQREGWARACELILRACLAQPAVLVHRDYHSRNLMVCAPRRAPGAGPAPNPGVLDFQDAVWGPVTYDLASLLRDAYIEWEEPQQIDWAVRYWQRARRAGLPVAGDFGDFWRDFEWMGLQRHLKVLGIFARLYHRDGKDGYLADLPRVWRYAHRVATRYGVLTPLARLLEQVAEVPVRDGWTF